MNIRQPTKLPHMKAPCRDCPMTKQCPPGWLGSKRMSEILQQGSFVCHKRTDLQCAGHMLLQGQDNDFVALARRLDMLLDLRDRARVFDTAAECIAHHGGDQ